MKIGWPGYACQRLNKAQGSEDYKENDLMKSQNFFFFNLPTD